MVHNCSNCDAHCVKYYNIRHILCTNSACSCKAYQAACWLLYQLGLQRVSPHTCQYSEKGMLSILPINMACSIALSPGNSPFYWYSCEMLKAWSGLGMKVDLVGSRCLLWKFHYIGRQTQVQTPEQLAVHGVMYLDQVTNHEYCVICLHSSLICAFCLAVTTVIQSKVCTY